MAQMGKQLLVRPDQLAQAQQGRPVQVEQAADLERLDPRDQRVLQG
jgi:hypothetical protein